MSKAILTTARLYLPCEVTSEALDTLNVGAPSCGPLLALLFPARKGFCAQKMGASFMLK